MSLPSIDSVILDIGRPCHQRRPSRFKEGSEQIGDELKAADTYLLSVLSEMDRYEERRRSCVSLHETSRRHKSSASNSSVESFSSASTCASSSIRSHPCSTPVIGRRKISFGQDRENLSQKSSQGHEMTRRESSDTWHEVKKGLMDKFRVWSINMDAKFSRPYPKPRTWSSIRWLVIRGAQLSVPSDTTFPPSVVTCTITWLKSTSTSTPTYPQNKRFKITV